MIAAGPLAFNWECHTSPSETAFTHLWNPDDVTTPRKRHGTGIHMICMDWGHSSLEEALDGPAMRQAKHCTSSMSKETENNFSTDLNGASNELCFTIQ